MPYVPPQPIIKSNKVKTKKVIINLPPKITRKNIHNDYREFCQNLNPPIKVMGYSSFRHFISEQFPNLRFSKPEKPAIPKFGTENDSAVKHQYDSDQETHEDNSVSNPTTIPLVMTSTNPDPTPSTFSSGGNTFVITQVLPAGFVPVNLSSCQMQGFPVSMPDQTPGSNIVMAPTSSMSVPPSGHGTYTFSNV
jgi:hypothetical protein